MLATTPREKSYATLFQTAGRHREDLLICADAEAGRAAPHLFGDVVRAEMGIEALR